MSGPHPSVAGQRLAVRQALGGLPPGALVLVGCSGGPDSLALAAATAFVAPRAGWRAGAVVVDHGLQAGSSAVAARAAGQCIALGLDPVEVVPVIVGGSRGRAGDRWDGPEAVARDARLTALDDAAGRRGALAVLLGHTLDDQAESVLLGLARGSGGRSLAGMAPRRGRFVRPFLGVRRTDTERACAELGLDPWLDPTNTVTTPAPSATGVGGGDSAASRPTPSPPLRNQVRHLILPVLEDVLGPGVAPALARTADLLRDDADLLEDLAATVLAQAAAAAAAAPQGLTGVGTWPDAAVVLDVGVLADAPRALRTRALLRAMVQAGLAAGTLTHAHVVAVDALVVTWHGQGPVHLPDGGRAQRRCGRLAVVGTTRGSSARWT